MNAESLSSFVIIVKATGTMNKLFCLIVPTFFAFILIVYFTVLKQRNIHGFFTPKKDFTSQIQTGDVLKSLFDFEKNCGEKLYLLIDTNHVYFPNETSPSGYCRGHIKVYFAASRQANFYLLRRLAAAAI